MASAPSRMIVERDVDAASVLSHSQLHASHR